VLVLNRFNRFKRFKVEKLRKRMPLPKLNEFFLFLASFVAYKNAHNF